MRRFLRLLAARRLAGLAIIPFLSLAPGLPAQQVARPRPSVLWHAAPASAVADTSPTGTDKRWTQSNGAAAGAAIGVLAGFLGGYWKCHNFGSSGGGSGCGGDMLMGAVAFGALGLALGSIAGADAGR
jgi:hypothetical protein